MTNLKPINATGTVWHIEILDANFNQPALETATRAFLENFEQKYSRFRNDSWLNRLNDLGVFDQPSEEFKKLLRQSIAMYKKTHGVFNIAIGQKMISSGYDTEYSFTESESVRLPNLSDVLTVTEDKISLTNGTLDLGGIGKGFLIDLLAKLYQDVYGLKYFIINGGGDIYATSDHESPIVISLQHPENQELSIGNVSLYHQGFASSSPHIRAWKDRITGSSHNHLHTTNKITSYVVSATCCDADVWATTLAIDPSQNPDNNSFLLVQDQKVLHQDEIFKLNLSA
jgi:thiamine biosynthesis lipoprotein